MSKSLAVSERKLLTRLQIRLILFYMVAFLAFEGAVMAFTYIVVNRSVMTPMYQSIDAEWKQKLPEALQLLAPETVADKHVQVSVDTSPEQIATWMIAANGRMMKEDLGIPTAKVAKPLVDKIFAKSKHSEQRVWMLATVKQDPILLGAKPVYDNHHHRLGTMISIRSLHIVDETVAALAHVEIYLGLGSVLLLLPLTYLLSKGTLTPIRSALVRQRNFVNDAAHELRTPLTILHGTLELAQSDTNLGSVQEAIQSSLDETDYITGLIGDLSTLARMESGVTELNLKQANLSEVVGETVEGLWRLAHKKEISMGVSVSSETVHAIVDERRIRQLLTILIDNAIKYTPTKGKIKISLNQIRHDVVIRVTDTGIGIPEKDLPHIFDRFYRTTQAASKASGSGIGLAIGAWIVQAHRGRISVESQVAKGTTFKVILPVDPLGSWPKPRV